MVQSVPSTSIKSSFGNENFITTKVKASMVAAQAHHSHPRLV